MAITIHPHTPGVPAQQCLPRSAFAKRFFIAPTLSATGASTVSPVASCADRLAEAQAAYHAVSMGRSVQYVSHEGRAVTYTPANSAQLYRYIKQLEAECGAAATVGHISGCGCYSCSRSLGRGRARGVVTL